jgi:hypothetical protein
MNKFKTMFSVALITVSVGVFASGCTVKARTGGNPTIVYYGGYYGYYTNSVFCDWANNYCGTGLAYGIYDNGGGYSGGSSGSYGSSGSDGSGGVVYSGGSSGSSGTVYSGGSSGSSGTITSGGSSGTVGSSGSSGTSGSDGSSDSLANATRDTDLQQANLEQTDVTTRAQSVSQQFQMNYSAAVQLTELADKVQTMTKSGSMTSEDRQAITESALGVAGISSDDMNSAIASMIKDGNSDAVNTLMDKAATNLGMPSSAALRDQILPALGINVGASN